MKKFLFLTCLIPLNTLYGKEILAPCSDISIWDTPAKENNLYPFFQSLKNFENSLNTNNYDNFSKLIHPSVLKQEIEKQSIFNDLYVKKTSLSRIAIHRLEYDSRTLDHQCPQGMVHRLVGPKEQVLVIHQLGNNRMTTIFARAPGENKPYALSLIHTQQWLVGRDDPFALLQKSKKQQDLPSWLLQGAALKILQGNPYVVPSNIEPLELEWEKNKTHLLSSKNTQLINVLNSIDKSLSLIDFTTVFKPEHLALGVKIKIDKDDISTDKGLDLCQSIANSFKPILKPLKANGMECLLYLKHDVNTLPPSFGSKYFSWSEGLLSLKNKL